MHSTPNKAQRTTKSVCLCIVCSAQVFSAINTIYRKRARAIYAFFDISRMIALVVVLPHCCCCYYYCFIFATISSASDKVHFQLHWRCRYICVVVGALLRFFACALSKMFAFAFDSSVFLNAKCMCSVCSVRT